LENDACPNVVLEALSCGLPVIHVPSGGVPELVRDAGATFTTDDEFRAALESVMNGRDTFAAQARQIALDNHQLDDVFARYMDAIRGGERRALPARGVTVRAAIDHKSYELRQEIRKWRRILTGKQSLRGPRP